MNIWAKKYNKMEDKAGECDWAVDWREEVAELIRHHLEEGDINMTLKEFVEELEKDDKMNGKED